MSKSICYECEHYITNGPKYAYCKQEIEQITALVLNFEAIGRDIPKLLVHIIVRYFQEKDKKIT